MGKFACCRYSAAIMVSGIMAMLGYATNALGAIDDTLYASYELDNAREYVYLTVCGSLPLSEGCYAQIPIRVFKRVGALMEGYPSSVGDTVARRLYILDVESGPTADGVRLYVYRKDDVISASTDLVTVTLETSVDLPLIGGKSAAAYMAANEDYLLIGTDQGITAMRVRKGSYAMVPFTGCGENNLTAMTADNYGNITFIQGNGF